MHRPLGTAFQPVAGGAVAAIANWRTPPVRIASMVLGSLLAVAAIAGCASTPAATPAGGATPAGATPPTGAASAPAGSETASVSIVDFAFEPSDVSVGAGATVTWVNDGQQPHTVKWSDDEPESRDLANGDDYDRTFDTPGTYDYICGIHPDMTGSVTVGE